MAYGYPIRGCDRKIHPEDLPAEPVGPHVTMQEIRVLLRRCSEATGGLTAEVRGAILASPVHPLKLLHVVQLWDGDLVNMFDNRSGTANL